MLTILIRTVILYLFVTLAMRLMGKRQVADMQTSDLVTTLIISEVASLPMQNIDQPLLSGVIPVLVLVAVEIILSVLMMKSRRLRAAVCGHPIVVIHNGRILEEQLRRLRISYEDLFSLLRQHDQFSFANIRYGIIESNGTLSILKNEDVSGEEFDSEEIRRELAQLDQKAKGGETS